MIYAISVHFAEKISKSSIIHTTGQRPALMISGFTLVLFVIANCEAKQTGVEERHYEE
jgi:hypothetical protein